MRNVLGLQYENLTMILYEITSTCVIMVISQPTFQNNTVNIEYKSAIKLILESSLLYTVTNYYYVSLQS